MSNTCHYCRLVINRCLVSFHVRALGVDYLASDFCHGRYCRQFVGRWLFRVWDALVGRIHWFVPFIRAYTALQTLFKPGGQSFRKVLLVEYPREGLWSLAFQTGDATPEVSKS